MLPAGAAGAHRFDTDRGGGEDVGGGGWVGGFGGGGWVGGGGGGGGVFGEVVGVGDGGVGVGVGVGVSGKGGKDEDADGRGMSPAFLFRCRDSLHAMHSGFRAQEIVGSR